MDDRQAQFLIAVADLSAAAATADLPVEVRTLQGEVHDGIPTPVSAGFGSAQLEQIGYSDPLYIDGHGLPLQDIIACTIRAPEPGDDG